MKFNKFNLLHYFIFIFSLILNLAVIPIAFIPKNNKRNKTIVLYGHKFYGNIKSIYESKKIINAEVYFLTLDKKYYSQLKKEISNVLYGLNFFHLIKVVRTEIFICDHGLHFFKLFMVLNKTIFIDTNHGLPFHKDAFYKMNYYKNFNEVWIMSDFHKQLFYDFNYKGSNLNVTGYGRLDNLIIFNSLNKYQKNIEIKKIKKSYDFDFEKIILLAPTWVHDKKILIDSGYPFNKSEFYENLNNFCNKNNSLLIYRPHLNDILPNEIFKKIKNLNNIKIMGLKDFPATEDFLKVADILITDWSSISIDFLALDKPVLFINSPNPFKFGALNIELLRFGEIVNKDNINEKISDYLKDKNNYFKNNKQHKKIKSLFLDIGLDGNSTLRYVKIINNYLKS